MRIVIDMQGAQNGSRYRGIGRYSLAFARAVIRNRGQHNVVIVLSDLFPETIMDMRAVFEPELGTEGVRVWSGLSPAYFLDPSNDWRRRTSQVLREAFIESLDPDIVLITSMIEGCGDDSITSIGEFSSNIFTAVIFYDLIPLIYEKEYLADPRVRAWYAEKVAQLKKADLWLAISQSTCNEGAEHIGLDRERLLNISAAVGPEFSVANYSDEEISKFNERFGVTRPFLMYSGATDPRKNVRGLINAWAMLPEAVRSVHQLALVGGMPSDHRYALERYAQSRGVHLSELVFSGRVNDDDLLVFYRLCKAFIFPSLHEGFGLPALEAMACGAPTIGSNCSSIPEVIDMPTAMFDPRSPVDIANHIARVLSDEDYRSLLVENGRKRATMFSWDQSAQIALDRFNLLEAEGKIATKQLARSGVTLSQELVKVISDDVPQNIDKADLICCAAAIAQIIPRADLRPCIYVDISELHRRDSRSGIQRVVRSVAKCLLTLGDELHAIRLVYATENEPYRHAWGFSSGLLKSDDIGMGLDDEVIDPRPGDIFLGLDYQDQIVIAHASYYQYLRMHGVRVCFVVYDLLPITLEGIFSDEVRANFEKWLDVVSGQDAVICISRAIANEFEQWRQGRLGNRAAPISIDWFHLGADVENSEPSKGLPNNAADQLRCMSEKPSFLMVGTIEPRKGYAQVLDAFEQIWALGVVAHLVLVGRQGWMVDELAKRLHSHSQMGVQLFWIEAASDEYLERIYATCTCLIAASIGEGFGLPLIEAARHKLPLIVRDLAVFREVAGEHAFYFTGTQPEELASVLQNWLALLAAGKQPKSDDMPWLTWKQSAERLMAVILSQDSNEKSMITYKGESAC